MSVYKRPGSQTYSYDFVVKGVRFSGNTEAVNKKEAQAIEKRLKIKARSDVDNLRNSGNGPLIMTVATARYWDEVGQFHRDSNGTFHQLSLLNKFFGPDKRLDEIRDADVIGLVAWRRAQAAKGRRGVMVDGKVVPKLVSNATVNRTTVEPLRKVFIRARRYWHYHFPDEPVWSDHRLNEPPERVRELHADEEQKLADAQREDYRPWFQFAHMTGLRLKETLLTWNCVNWEKRVIETVGKRGLPVRTPITPAIAAILEPLKGHHQESVFTYVCRRPKPGKKKGTRYPITYSGAKSEWQAQRARAKIEDFRFHDVRHDMATNLLRQTGNLKLVSKALNHRDIKTTARYAHVVDAELANALQAMASAKEKAPTEIPTAPIPKAANDKE